MNSSWQLKRGSALQSSMPAMASSTSQEAQDQTEISSAHYFYSQAGQDLRFHMHGRMPDPTVPSITNITSCSSTPSDVSSSFLGLLSGPASLLQFDFQELPNPKLFNASSKLANEIGSVAVSPSGRQVPLTSGRLPSENMSYQNLRIGDDLYPIVSSRAEGCSNSGSSSVFQNRQPAANISLQGSDLAKTAVHHNVNGNEKVKDFHSLREERHSMSLINGVKLQNADNQMLQKLPLEVKYSVCNNSSIFTSGCPRVFCLDRSGDLLLSNIGLLGILCSCHCFHMSVSRFCEHSGLYNVNPGDAVHMESGETISQWRKLNFQKFGIRIPEDQSGWDWPEGLSLTPSLMKSGVSMSNMLKNSDCSNLVGSSGDLLRSRWPLGDVSSKNFPVNKNLVSDDLHDKQHINGQDGNKVYHKGLLGTSKSNSCDVGDKHVTACSISRCSTMPKFAYGGPESICQSIYIDALATTHPTVQNQRALIKNSDVSRGEDVQDFTLIDKIASSSSIELKLGQPYQKIHSPGKPVLPVIGPQFYNTNLNSQKQFSQEQIIHNVISCMAEEESRHYLPCAVGLSNFTIRREQDHLNHTNCAINNTLDAAKLEQLKGNMAKTSAVSLFKHCTLSEGSSQSRATDDLHNVREHVIPKTQHCESHAVKCDINAPRNASNHLDKRNMIPELSISKLADKGKGEGCLGGNSYVQTASGSKLLKWMENTKSFTGVVHGNNISVFPPMHDGSHYSHCSSNMPPYASDAGNSTNCLENVPFSGSSGHIDHVFLRSMGSSRDYKQNLASQGVSIGSTSSTSNLSPGFLAAMTNQDCSGISPRLFDDNLRLLALGQMLELSKQHVVSSLGKTLEEGKCNNSSNVKMQHSFVEPSTFEEQRHAPNLIRREDISEIAMKMKSDLSDPPCKKASNVEKFTSVTGKCTGVCSHSHSFNRWCNYPTLKQGMPPQCQEFGTHYQLSHNPLYNERSLLRLNGSQSINCPNGHESCCQKTFYFQCNCSCVAHTKCLLGNCNAIAGNPPTSLRKQTGSVSCKTPVPIASQFAKDHAIPKENVVSFDQCGTMRGQLPRNVFCSGSQWKDVPSKVKKVCELAYVKQSADALNERNELFQLQDSAAKHSKGAVHGADSFKKQDMSNISSGCSTEASIEATDLDSSTIVGNTGYANNIIVDEGSGIDKCWSSDDAIESHRSADFYGFTGESYLRRQKSCKVVGYKSARSLLDEVKLMDSLAWKKGQNRKHIGITVHGKSNKLQESDKSFKSGKRKREMKMKTLDSLSGTAVPLLHGKSSECDDTSDWHCLSKNVPMVSSGPESSWASGVHSIEINQKRGNSKLTVTKTLAGKRDVLQCYDAGDGEDDHETEINRDSSSKNLGISGRKKLRSNQTAVICMQFQIQESTQAVGEKTEMYNSENFTKTSSQQVNLCDRKPKPVVCGKYGEIINRNTTGDVLEPVKIVSLDRVLKTAKRCSLSKSYKAGLTSSKELKGTNFSWSNACFEKSSSLTKEIEMRCNNASVCEEMDIHISMEERDNMFASGNELYVDEFLMVGKKDQRSEEGHTIQDTTAHPCSRPKHKDRKRSLYELTLRGKNPGTKMISQKKIFECAPKIHWENILKNTDESYHQKSREVKRCIREQKDLPITDIDLFCCVCGSSNKDEVNCLLECDQCSIRVHQTCYGVSKVPKGNWYCRPCRMNSKNIGLLQSEAEGVNDENVGFYGRCERHAAYPTNISSCYAANVAADHSGEKEASCARTEGYKGRKRDGFWHNINIQSKGKGGCLVPQEQVNAWIHINGQKSCAHGLLKLPMSEKEYDCRKEYTRYRQAKGWKHLVVYKSGIHALGLYTSRFISRGEMVVEYVGEIVGLRVADKRENEYQYGRRLQYKSACYFFRIDKEHIIDATCKGGIARFVNHSCRPNCVAKVISVRNEKKVVFFAERDIYPGEEITYDYHFNHEDEGKKIPCFCDAKNCRRYLN